MGRPGVESGALLLERRGPGQDVGKRGPVLALEPLDERQPVLDLLEARRRGVEALPIVAEREREVLELGLDAVAGAGVRRERRVDGRQLTHPLPDLPERREGRRLLVVEQRIAPRCTAW